MKLQGAGNKVDVHDVVGFMSMTDVGRVHNQSVSTVDRLKALPTGDVQYLNVK